MTMLAPDHDLSLEGVVNFRDFGRGRKAGSGAVRAGRLFRSGHHAEATDADLARLEALGLALVVDLRRAHERAREQARRPPACKALILEHGGPEDAVAPHLAFLADPEASEGRIRDWMQDFYRSYPFDPHYVEVFRRYFEHLSELDGPVLVNCHAGKDRTGVLCALTLHLLGVSRREIYEDFLLTNAQNRVDARMGELTRRFEEANGVPAVEALLRYVMGVEASYLDAAFAAIEGAHGSADAYLAEVAGVSADRRDRIRARLLDPV